MKFFENIRLAFVALRANKMRAFLTMLGIIIGIGSVIGILTVGGGLTNTVTGYMSDFGASTVVVSLQMKAEEEYNDMSSMMGAMTTAIDPDDLITEEMITNFYNKYQDKVEGVSLSESVGSGRAQDRRLYANVSITGINEDYMDVNRVTVTTGRSILERDIEGARYVAVVSDRLVNNMFSGNYDKALGSEVVVTLPNSTEAFTIIGIYTHEDSMMNMSMAAEKDISTAMYIPISTAKRITGGESGYATFLALAKPGYDSVALAREATMFFAALYENNRDYTVQAISMESIVSSFSSMLNTLNIAIAVIAGISLLVGGIGVMNIMLVSVTERTREIGTRKALGATNLNIRIQFVTESVIVCLIGGIIGILFGGVLGYVGSSLLDAPSFPTVSSILISAGFSAAIGIFFGYYPANKAAKLDPIEALRYE